MTKVFKNKTNSIIIAIIMIAIFVFCLYNTFQILEINSAVDLQNIIYDVQHTKDGWNIIVIAILVFLVQIFLNPFTLIIASYFTIKFFHNLSNLKHKVHPKFNIEYFRDDLSDISPGIASFLVDLEINFERDIPAHVLKLTLDGYIKEIDNKYIVINKDKSKLLESDKLILRYVESGFKDSSLLALYKKAIINESQEKGYIKNNNKTSTLITMFLLPVISILLTYVLVGFGFFIFEKNIVIGLIIIGIYILFMLPSVFCFPWGLIIYIFILAKYGSYRRTKEGNILLEQIMGLKNYLEDFSNLDETNLNELLLREYYLVYAIVLEINDNAHDEMLAKIRNQIKN